jgi:hypothetical protein
VPGDLGSEMNALNFGVQLTDDIDETAVRILTDLSANPQSPCGNIESGSGFSILHVTVRGIIGGSASAILEIYDHNVTNGSAFDKYQITIRADILDVIK